MQTAATAKKHILVIKLGALGDVVQALGPMQAIRDHHTDDHVSVLTTPSFEQLIAGSGVADDIWIDQKPRAHNIGGWLALRKKLRRGGFARVYDLQTSDRSSGYYRLFWPGPYPEWSGIAAGCSHPHANPGRDAMHTLERQAEQLQMAGIQDTPVSDLSRIISDLSPFNLPAAYCLIVPGGAGHRPEKRWPLASYQQLVRHLDKGPVTPVICGGPDERVIGDDLVAGTKAALNLAGRTSLIDLVALAKQARFAVGNDSGPMHIAAFAGTPSVVLYAQASDPALCAQRGPNVTILRRPSLTEITLDDVCAALPDKGGS